MTDQTHDYFLTSRQFKKQLLFSVSCRTPSHLLQAKQSFEAVSLSSVLLVRAPGSLLLLCPGSSSEDLSSSGMVKMSGLAEVACSSSGRKRGGVASAGRMLEQLRQSHSPLGRSLGSTGGSLCVREK